MGIMFRLLFRARTASIWNKASKRKRLMRQLRYRLMIRVNRTTSIIRQSKSDIAQLYQNSHREKAFDMVEQLHKGMCLMSEYHKLDRFLCHSTLSLTPLVEPVKEVMSNLIFASSRFGDLTELMPLRILLREHYGCEFIMTNIELLPENSVKDQVYSALLESPGGGGSVRRLQILASYYFSVACLNHRWRDLLG
ncbi:hypothetical protein FNV43_RR24324 [Rhamnella rubrinervis]|uniref:Uncharacterized protein n=1 Tax=Rhamnella rubrinervis TaxID=2594499 RepID=A0A8K0DXV8_9ROSA|nr:hypothetical protein FNV43_RR24324 [Rhamnella rubrinervis]